MATQYDPIAKDGSLNTTEATPRNIADVLAEGLKGIEDALPTYTEGDGIDISNNEISVDTTFTEASTRANIASGESFSTILGKIKKFFADLKAVAFSGNASDLTYDNTTSGLTATEVQSAIDEVDGTLDRFTNGVAIPANADLNTITTSGTYYSPNNATTQSLTNCPVPQYGFEMNVFNWGGNTAQFIHGYDGAYFRRALTDSWSTLATIEDFKPSSGTTSGLTSSYGTIQTGYVRIGNMIVLNMRFTVGNTAVPAGTLFVSGLPPATESTLNHVACSTNQAGLAIQINGDKLQNPFSSIPANSILFVSAVYFTDM